MGLDMDAGTGEAIAESDAEAVYAGLAGGVVTRADIANPRADMTHQKTRLTAPTSGGYLRLFC